MQRNIGSHKRPVISTKTDFYKVFRELMFVHFNRREVLNKEKKHGRRLYQISADRRRKKYNAILLLEIEIYMHYLTTLLEVKAVEILAAK